MSRIRAKGVQLIKLVVRLFLLIVMFCFAMFQGGFVSWFIFFTVVPFLAYSIVLMFMPIRITDVRRTIKPDVITRGGKVIIKVRFRNRTLFPIAFLTVREKVDTSSLEVHMEGRSDNLFLVGFRRHFEWEYELRNVPRGEFVLDGLEVVVTDFFGWTQKNVFVEKSDLFLVYPKITEVAYKQVNLQYDQGNTNVRRSLIKDTTMATGVRKYEPGDRFSWIHWKAFAKNGELRTKEFEDIQAQSLVLYLDKGIQPDFEGVVDLAASLLKIGVQNRAELSFFTSGSERKMYPLIRTESQLDRVMQYLATTQMDDITTLIEHAIQAEHQLVSRSVVMIVTSRMDRELEKLLMSGAKYARAILCFVVVSEEQFKEAEYSKRFAGQNKIVYLTEAMFSRALLEVGKA